VFSWRVLQKFGAFSKCTRVSSPLAFQAPNPLPVSAFNLLTARRNFSGSAIGGIAETQEMLDFCAERGIVSDIEVIPIQTINEAWARLLRQDVKYRFVIDMESLQSEVAAR
jgi:alcohol dehydrogenase (NADP+)